jgi:selenocysteine lyase/cysteine desulfurase
MAIVDLVNAHGATVVFGINLVKAIHSFISGLKQNLEGKNAVFTSARNQNVMANLTLLAVLGNEVKRMEFASHICQTFY